MTSVEQGMRRMDISQSGGTVWMRGQHVTHHLEHVNQSKP